MEEARARWQRARRWALIVATWTAVGGFAALQAEISARQHGRSTPWPVAASWLVNIWLWAAWTGTILWWSRRLPIEGRHRWRNAAAHAALGVAYAAASSAVSLAYARAVLDSRSTFAVTFVGELFYNVISYGAVVLLAHAASYLRQLGERRVRTVQLEHELTRAQLAALELQLRPHFLFNTLHSVAGLVRAREPDAAIHMIGQLGDLLRAVLVEDDAQEIALGDELAFAERYLAIERVRFADRLRVELDVAPEARRALVPRLVLLPLVENAIRHGVQTREEGGTVRVRAACRGGALELEIIDEARDGAGDPDARTRAPAGHGIGLHNTRRRLDHLYGTAHHLELLAAPGGGTRIRVVVPCRFAPAGGRS